MRPRTEGHHRCVGWLQTHAAVSALADMVRLYPSVAFVIVAIFTHRVGLAFDQTVEIAAPLQMRGATDRPVAVTDSGALALASAGQVHSARIDPSG